MSDSLGPGFPLLFPSLASGAAVGIWDSDISSPGLLWASWVCKGPEAMILLFGFFFQVDFLIENDAEKDYLYDVLRMYHQ